MKRLLIALALAVSVPPPALAQQSPPPAAGHPLDALSWSEHWRVLTILESAGHIADGTRFTRVEIAPPDKAKVWAAKDGMRIPRIAEVRGKEGQFAIEGLVDLDRGQVISWNRRNDVQPSWLLEEFLGAPVAAVKRHPEYQAALKRRGIDTTKFLNCRAMPMGNFEEPRYAGRRIAMVRCDPVNDVTNLFVRRVEGISAIVDVSTNEVLEIDDYAVIPPAKTTADYDDSALPQPRTFPTPISLSQPDGPSFKLEGGRVEWSDWKFHIRHDQRVGLVISTATFRDAKGEDRKIMYEGHLSEIFVPYMDPSRDWYSRTLLDAGEYSMGGLAGSLVKGIDCPETAQMIDGIVVQDNGRPSIKKDVFCLFERTTGDMSWRHADNGRPKRELVARMVADLGNYDYVFDWIFESDGQFRIAIGATGIVAVQQSLTANATKPTEADKYGRFVDRNVVAINHDHYFNFRLDLDIDGASNNFIRDSFSPVALPPESARRSIWVSDEHVAATEADGMLDRGHVASMWRVSAASRRNAMGYATSYQLMTGHSADTLMSEDEVARQRAGFIDHDLWVTAYDPSERYAAGEYAVLSKPGQGLPAYSRGRPLAGKDIVVWPTVGMQHKVRSEDWPVMPVLWHEIVLRPFDFHDRNPSLTIGKEP